MHFLHEFNSTQNKHVLLCPCSYLKSIDLQRAFRYSTLHCIPAVVDNSRRPVNKTSRLIVLEQLGGLSTLLTFDLKVSLISHDICIHTKWSDISMMYRSKVISDLLNTK